MSSFSSLQSEQGYDDAGHVARKFMPYSAPENQRPAVSLPHIFYFNNSIFYEVKANRGPSC